jgi:hypothetical protein
VQLGAHKQLRQEHRSSSRLGLLLLLCLLALLLLLLLCRQCCHSLGLRMAHEVVQH